MGLCVFHAASFALPRWCGALQEDKLPTTATTHEYSNQVRLPLLLLLQLQPSSRVAPALAPSARHTVRASVPPIVVRHRQDKTDVEETRQRDTPCKASHRRRALFALWPGTWGPTTGVGANRAEPTRSSPSTDQEGRGSGKSKEGKQAGICLSASTGISILDPSHHRPLGGPRSRL